MAAIHRTTASFVNEGNMHYQVIPMPSADKAQHIWSYWLGGKKHPLAHLQLDLARRSISKICFIGKQNICNLFNVILTDLLRALKYPCNERIPYMPFEPLFSCVARHHHKQAGGLLKSWLEKNGDPHVILKTRAGFISALAVLSHNWDKWAEAFLRKGLDPYSLQYSYEKNGQAITYTTTLAFLAVERHSHAVIQLMIDRGFNIDYPIEYETRNLPHLKLVEHPRCVCTPIAKSINDLDSEMVQLLLRGGANPNQKICEIELVEHLLQHPDKDRSKKAEILKILLDHGVSLQTVWDSYYNRPTILQMILQAGTGEATPPPLEEVKSLIQEIYRRKLLGHRFGVSLSTMTFGSDAYIPVQTDGFLLEEVASVLADLERSLKEFFKNFSLPELIKKNVSAFFASAEVTPQTAGAMIENFKNGEVVFFIGDWPEHTVQIALYGSCLFVCNRGDYREKEAKPGIHVYRFTDPSQFTKKRLLQLHRSPSVLLGITERKELGIEEGRRLITLVTSAQPGGFCVWDNLKLGVHLLLTLSLLPKRFAIHTAADLNTLQDSHEKAEDLYKHWSQFDRNLALADVLTDYERRACFTMDIPLMLHILAYHKGSLEMLMAALKKADVQPTHFLTLDADGRSVFHRVSSMHNLHALQEIAGKHWQSICYELINARTVVGDSPLGTALFKQHWSVVKALVRLGADPNETLLEMPVCHLACRANDPRLLQFLVRKGANFTRGDSANWIGLNIAISTHANKVVRYLMETMSNAFLFSEDMKNAYLQLAREESNWEAYAVLYTAWLKQQASLDLFRNSIRSLKLPFLASLRQNFSTM